MTYLAKFFFNSIMLGVGLAMDAFSVSLANGFAESKMKKKRMAFIAGIYAGFQFLMPMIGWVLVHGALSFFNAFQPFIPWIALVLLAFIGGKLLIEGIKEKKCSGDGDCLNCTNTQCENYGIKKNEKISTRMLLMQGVATAIDALSVGFTISDYTAMMALGASLIIGAVTYVICFAGLGLGTKFGTKLAGNAKIIGGIILIAIGIEICFF
jgi:putative Mn2+ efflux pump MntP